MTVNKHIKTILLLGGIVVQLPIQAYALESGQKWIYISSDMVSVIFAYCIFRHIDKEYFS